MKHNLVFGINSIMLKGNLLLAIYIQATFNYV